jgi:hypothetical protein
MTYFSFFFFIIRTRILTFRVIFEKIKIKHNRTKMMQKSR